MEAVARDDESKDGGSQAVSLRESDAGADPFALFRRWFDEARKACEGTRLDPTAMTLATATGDARPNARLVLLKQFDERGFVFYTDRTSQKGRELRANARAALVFHWPPLERQVRVTGDVEELDEAAARDHFDARPRGHQIASHAAHQSRVIPGRDWLDERVAELEEQFGKEPVPMPERWVGFRVVPSEIEFWQGRPNRLHDRLRYRRLDTGAWHLDRLAP